MTKKEYKKQFSEDDTPGWAAIDDRLAQIYPGQEPKHYAPEIHFAIGGEDPLDGISVYLAKESPEHYHFVSYGFSQLYYDEDSAGEDFSKFGFEMTFRLKKQGDQDSYSWALNLMQNLAKYVFKSGRWFEPNHVIPANGPIRLDYDTALTALAFTLDPTLGKIDTPHGEVQFLQMVGITAQEYAWFKEDPVLDRTAELLEKLKKDNPLLITDLDRKTSMV